MSNQQRQRCPVCGKFYTERPAVSRKDGKTSICPDCGMREAIEALAQSCRVAQSGTMDGLTYQDIRPEINKVCKAHPGCWHTPAAKIDCPYVDVCRAKYDGPDNGNAAFEVAVVARYKELKSGTKYGISILPEDCQAYADGYRYGAYKQIARGETHIVEFFKTKAEIQAYVNMNPLFRAKRGRDG